MGRRRRSDDIIDWRSVFLSYFSHDGAVGASSDSPAPAAPQGRSEEPRSEFERRFGPGAQADDGAPYFRLARFTDKAAVGSGPDVPSASKGVSDFSPVDEDKQGEHVSSKSPEFSGQEKNYGQENRGHGGKRKSTSAAKMHSSQPSSTAHAIDPEESDYESELPSRFSKRRKQQLQKSSGYSRKVQDVVILDDEDMEPKEEVNREMYDRLNEPKIYYPSRDDQEAVELTRSDIKCLNPEVFLSSPVINFYIKYIKRTRLCNENFRDKFYIFNTYFFGKLEEALRQPHDFPKLRRWWKGVNILNNAYIILPIHAREHWSLVIICLRPKERISEPIILHLDSLEMHRSTKILNTVGRFLEKEWRFLSVAEPAWPCLLSDIRKETVQVPQQNNAYDCGIFMLYYIEQFIKEAPARFTTDKLHMFNRSWFKPEEASGLRQRIRELLLEEFESVKRLNDAISEADGFKGYDSIKDGELEADDGSKMVVEVGVGLGNTVESNGGMKVAASEEANGESGDAIKSTGGIKVAASQEACEESRDASKSIEGMKVAASEEANGESGDAVKSTRGIKVAASQEASEESRDAGKSIEGMKVAASEGATGDAVKSSGGIKVAASQEASEESRDAGKSIEEMKVAASEEASGDAVKSSGGIKVVASQEASEESQDAGKSIEGMKVAVSEDASGKSGDAVKSTGGIKVAASQEATSEEFRGAGKSIEGINVAESEEASEGSGDALKSTGSIKVEASQEASEECRNAGKGIVKGINAAESKEASEVSSRDAAKRIQGISVVESDEASGAFGDTGKTNKSIKVAASEETSMESAGYPDKSMEDVADVAVLNKVPTSSSNRCNRKNAGCVVSERRPSRSGSVKGQKSTVKAGSGSSKAGKRKEGISVAESDEASVGFGDTGKTNKGIKVAASEEASMGSGYPAKSMEDVADVAVLFKVPTSSSNRCNGKNAGYVVSERRPSRSGSVKDRKGPVKAGPGSSKGTTAWLLPSEEGGLSATAWLERLKGAQEEPVPDAVCEISGTKVWITRVYRQTTWEPGNWSWSSGGSSRGAREAFLKEFARKQ